MSGPTKLVKSRPAESGGAVATACAMLIARAAGVTDADTIAYIAIVVGFVPFAISWLVSLLRSR